MYAVEIDRSKRLLVISAVQRVTAEQAKLAAQQTRELVRDVAPGFRVLADFRWLESMDPERREKVLSRMKPELAMEARQELMRRFHIS